MAHRTLIGGTGYDISGGRDLIGGTGYGKKKGRVLVNGTGYDVPFSSGFVLTMERASDSYGKQDPYSGIGYSGKIRNGVEYNGESVAFTNGGVVTVAAGDSVTIYVGGAEDTLAVTIYAPAVYLNGVYQRLTYINPPAGMSTIYKDYKYVYTPNGNATLKYTKKYTEGTGYTYVYITES